MSKNANPSYKSYKEGSLTSQGSMDQNRLIQDQNAYEVLNLGPDQDQQNFENLGLIRTGQSLNLTGRGSP